MPKPALNNRINRDNVYGRVIAHDLFLNQGVKTNDSPTFSSLYLTGDASIAGNLYVEGNTVLLNTEVISFEDNIIVINNQETGDGVTLNQAGLEIDRGTKENYRLVFKEDEEILRAGVISNMLPLTIRENSPLTNGIMIWDDANKIISARNSINLPTVTFQSTVESESSTTGSIVIAGGIGVSKNICTNQKIFLKGNNYSKRASIYTDSSTNNLTLTSSEAINLIPTTSLTIPINIPLVFGDSAKNIKTTLTNTLDINSDSDVNFNLTFTKRIIIPNLSPIVFSTNSERIFADSFNNMVIGSSQDILLQPSTNKKVLLPVNIPITFSNANQSIMANGTNDLLISANNHIFLTPGLNLDVRLPINNGIRFGNTGLQRIYSDVSNVLTIQGANDITITPTGKLTVSSTTSSINASTGALVVDGGVGIKQNLHVDGPLFQIPRGTTATRPVNATQGHLRYNTDTKQYEGYSFNDWVQLGGVIDANGDTKILPEEAAGINDDNLRFFTAGNENLRINSAGNIGIGTTSPQCKVQINGGLRSTEATIGNLLIENAILQIPTGTTATRPVNATQGQIRYNIQRQLYEGFGENNEWVVLGGVIDTNGDTKILAEEGYDVNDDNLRFITNGFERMRIDQTGNVGIGTTNPQHKLQIAGNVDTITMSVNGTTDSVDTSTGALLVSGGVGVSGKIHTNELHVNGNTVIGGDLTVNGTTITLNNEVQLISDNLIVLNSGPDGEYDAGIMMQRTTGSYAVMFYNTNYDDFQFVQTSSDPGVATVVIDSFKGLRSAHIHLMETINSSGLGTGGVLTCSGGASIGKDVYIGGKVYINDTTELEDLIINGDRLQVPSGNTSTRPLDATTGSIRYNTELERFEGLEKNGSWVRLDGLSDSDGNTKITTEENPGENDDNLRFFTAGVQHMIVSSAGNVGIGNTNPNYKLDIIGSVYCKGTIVTSSDRRLKKDIHTIDNALNKIERLRGVYYTDKETNKNSIGVIAQEVESVLPEVVSNEGAFKGVEYSNIIGVLIEGIKELKGYIKILEDKIDILENK